MDHYFGDLEVSRTWVRQPEVYEKIIATAVISHYDFKSRKDFLLRTRRSLAGQFSDQREYEGDYHSGHVDDVTLLARDYFHLDQVEIFGE